MFLFYRGHYKPWHCFYNRQLCEWCNCFLYLGLGKHSSLTLFTLGLYALLQHIGMVICENIRPHLHYIVQVNFFSSLVAQIGYDRSDKSICIPLFSDRLLSRWGVIGCHWHPFFNYSEIYSYSSLSVLVNDAFHCASSYIQCKVL